MFATAERPIILVGQDIFDDPAAQSALRDIAARHRIPVVTTYKAKGILPEGNMLCLGGHGLSPKSDAIILPLLAQADLVIAAGYDPIEMRSGWRDPADPARMITFSSAMNDHFMHREALHFQCPVSQGLDLFEGLTPKAVWPGGEPEEVRAELAAAFAPTPQWGPGAALDTLCEAHPKDATMTVDSGAHRILLSQMLRCDYPGQVLQSTGLCTMGCALPLASGFAIARPGHRVFAVMGDGCLDMVLGELATLRDLGLPVTVVVLVDGSYALIAQKQRAEGYVNAGVDFGETDYVAIAQGVSIPAYRADDVASLSEAIDAALGISGPCLIAIEVPRQAYTGLI